MKGNAWKAFLNFPVGLLISLFCFEILFTAEFLSSLSKANQMFISISESTELISLICCILVFYGAVSLVPGMLYGLFCLVYSLMRNKGVLWRSHFFFLASVTLAVLLYRWFYYPSISIAWIETSPILFAALIILLSVAAGIGAIRVFAKFPGLFRCIFNICSLLALVFLAGAGFFVLLPEVSENLDSWPEAEQADPDGRINVCLMTIDTLRADHLRCYSRKDIDTNNIDRLASEGIQFTSAFCQIPVTRPSHCSILTGKYPWEHGILSNVISHLDASHVTLAEVLTSRGYHSAAFVSAVPLHSAFGLKQGFEVYDDQFLSSIVLFLTIFRKEVPFMVPHNIYHFFNVKERARGQRDSRQTVGRAIEWLSRNYQESFFIWLHLFDPHKPYRPPAPFNTMYVRSDIDRDGAPLRPSPETLDYWLAQYAGEITYADRSIGRLLRAMEKFGVMENTLIIFASDHGESFEHDYYFHHSHSVYENLIHMPLIMRCPLMIPRGVTNASLVESIDLFPTILDMLKIDYPENIPGRSLLPLILGEKTKIRSKIFAGTVGGRNLEKRGLRAIRTENWKLILDQKTRKIELYDLNQDPEELNNLYHEKKEIARPLLQELDKWMASMKASACPIRTIEPADQIEENLKELGYLQ